MGEEGLHESRGVDSRLSPTPVSKESFHGKDAFEDTVIVIAKKSLKRHDE